MKNKDIETRLIEMYIKGWITKEELDKALAKLDKPKNKGLDEPPVLY